MWTIDHFVYTLNSHNSTGAIMQTGIYSYLVATQAQSELLGVAAKVINYRQPSYGTFGSSLAVSYYFGVPSKVSFAGVAMDIDQLTDNAESDSNCWNDWSDFNRQTGAIASNLENMVPEQLFSTEQEPLEGISAVKAIAIASQQGQKVFTLTSGNANLLAEVTIDSSARQEIQNALASGKEVTVHQEPINAFGWTGSAYVVINPDTGAGAYKISGGGNGSYLKGYLTHVGPFLGLLSLALSFSQLPLALFVGFLLALTLAIDALILYLWTADFTKCKSSTSFFIISVVAVLLAPFVGALAAGAALSLMWTVRLMFTSLAIEGAVIGSCT